MAEWWKNAIVYQIYPRSFKDSNGDGIGDLAGITENLDYLKDLGIDVIWINPIYCSPMEDNGYDISDYYKVDPIFGTNADMDHLLKEAQKRDIKILLDLVVNHCSDEHPWFQKAKADPDCEEAGYFYFQTTEDGQTPNNWRSNFGGSVWSRLPDKRWYYHTFSPKQPDLNWENPKLRKNIYNMINWWLDKGVAGFRIDAITFIKKDLTFASRKTDDGYLYPIENLTDYSGIEDFLTELKQKTFDRYDCMTVAEAPGVGKETFRSYAGKNGFFSMIFDFNWENMEGESDKSSTDAVDRWKKRIFQSQKFVYQNGWAGIFLENHDQSRCVNKFLEENCRNYYSTTALAVLYFYLYGTPFIYQGQEIGMTNLEWKNIDEMNDVRAKGMYQEALQNKEDPSRVLKYFGELGRDNARTPMQWENSKNAGFTKGKPWIKINENYPSINVADQEQDPLSVLSFYKKVTRLRHDPKYQAIFSTGDFTPLYEEIPALIAYARTRKQQTVSVIVNFKNQCQAIPSISGKCVLNNNSALSEADGQILLQPYQAVVFVSGTPN